VSLPLGRPARILLADDLALFRRAIATLLDEQEDMQVVGQAGNGVEAVEMAQALRPDIVVLDVEMPDMDGIAAAADVSKTGIKILLYGRSGARKGELPREVEETKAQRILALQPAGAALAISAVVVPS